MPYARKAAPASEIPATLPIIKTEDIREYAKYRIYEHLRNSKDPKFALDVMKMLGGLGSGSVIDDKTINIFFNQDLPPEIPTEPLAEPAESTVIDSETINDTPLKNDSYMGTENE